MEIFLSWKLLENAGEQKLFWFFFVFLLLRNETKHEWLVSLGKTKWKASSIGLNQGFNCKKKNFEVWKIHLGGVSRSNLCNKMSGFLAITCSLLKEGMGFKWPPAVATGICPLLLYGWYLTMPLLKHNTNCNIDLSSELWLSSARYCAGICKDSEMEHPPNNVERVQRMCM